MGAAGFGIFPRTFETDFISASFNCCKNIPYYARWRAGIRSNQVYVRFKDLLKVVCASPPSQDASFTKSHLHSFTIPSPILAFFSSLRSATSVLSPSTIPLKRVKVAHAHAKYARPKHVAICRRAGLLCGNMQQGGRREHGAYAIFIAQLEVGI